jgi:1-acyl-sn-glycerol-3-phosphate acyltransferase
MTWLRSLVFNAWFVLATLLYGLAGLAVRMAAPRRALWLATRWVRALLGGARLICGIRPVVIGRENLPAGPALIASQHQSAFDTLVWLTLVPRASYVFKAELARIPLFGPMLVPSGQIPLDRGASVASIRALLRAAERAVAEGRQIIIFPEGTRTEHGAMAPLRPGVSALANRTGLPVIPVATDSGLRWGRRAFRKSPGAVHLVIGAPIPPGLRQAELLAAIQAAWAEGSARMRTCG